MTGLTRHMAFKRSKRFPGCLPEAEPVGQVRSFNDSDHRDGKICTVLKGALEEVSRRSAKVHTALPWQKDAPALGERVSFS